MEAHGHLDLKWSDNILCVEAFGPFNDEGAKQAAEIYTELILNKTCETFAVIEILNESSMGSPDTMSEVANIWHFIGENGCTALALIYANEIQRSLAEDFLPEFGRIFSNIEDAEKWIRSLHI